MSAGPLPADALERDIEGSDLIVAGTVQGVSDVGGDPATVSPDARPEADRLRSGLVEVLRVLAGDAPGPTFEVLFLQGRVPSRPWTGLWTDQPLLLFLRSTARGHVLVNPTRIPIRTLSRIPSPPPGASAERAVAHELEQVILRADASAEARLLVEATVARVEMPSSLVATWPEALTDPEPLRRSAWIVVSLAGGRAHVLEEVPALFARPGSPETEVVKNLIIWKVAEVRDPRARSALTTLLTNPRVELARAAARALRALRDPGAAGDLVEALDHPDLEVRYQATMGLAELYPDAGPASSFERFRMHDEAFRARWRDWWRREGSRHPRPGDG